MISNYNIKKTNICGVRQSTLTIADILNDLCSSLIENSSLTLKTPKNLKFQTQIIYTHFLTASISHSNPHK